MAGKVKAAVKKKPRQYLTNEKGERTAVLMPIEEYEELIEAAEQLEDIRHLEKANRDDGEPIPWEQLKAALRAEGKLS